jgi:hypothetical protein
MTAPTDTLARMESPVKRRCQSCGRIFFAFSPLRETCFPQCGSTRFAANGKQHSEGAAALHEGVAPAESSEPCCGSGCSRCRVNTGGRAV